MGYTDNDKCMDNDSCRGDRDGCRENSCREDSHCDAKVIESKFLSEARNFPLCAGFAKIPIVLSEFTVQIDCEAKIKLSEPAIEIKRVKKNVYLTQCRLIAGTSKLFLQGYIRKDIEYVTKTCETKTGIGGKMKDTIVYIPFHCVTDVHFKRFPKLHPSCKSCETEYFDPKLSGKDPKQVDRNEREKFNEKVFCELEFADIYEADIREDGEELDCFPKEREFQCFTEKIVVYLGIKLLQKQQVHYDFDHKDGKEKFLEEDDCLYPPKYSKDED